MKRCPQCLFLFPDSDSKCDFDQTALEHVDDSAIDGATRKPKRRAWPIAELHPGRRWRLAATLAQRCACFELRLSQTSSDLIELLNIARNWSTEMEHRRTASPTRAVA